MATRDIAFEGLWLVETRLNQSTGGIEWVFFVETAPQDAVTPASFWRLIWKTGFGSSLFKQGFWNV